MSLVRVDHTAIVVRNLDQALERYYTLFGVVPALRAEMADQFVEAAFLTLGDSQLELLQPLDPSTGVAHYLARHGEGLHHIGIEVDDLEAVLRRLEANGAVLIDHVPRRGVHGWIAFVHPKSTGGTLIELVMKDDFAHQAG